ncbi:MAG: cyclic-phosphate processing receiver domain-containing protein [Isosphaeraceae bacterium]
MEPKIEAQTDDSTRRSARGWAWLGSRWLAFSRWLTIGSRWWKRLRLARSRSHPRPTLTRCQLFLDDDPLRAEIFLRANPQAVWVKNVAECLARLAEPWDEVHLDHDLGGKTFVDSNAKECGMEVIRWLCKEPRQHLKETLFFVHTHHAAAGLLMVLEMRRCCYKAEFRPFGFDLERLLAHNEPPSGGE